MLIRSVTRFTEKPQKSMSPKRLSLGIVHGTRARNAKFHRTFHGNFTNRWKMLKTQTQT